MRLTEFQQSTIRETVARIAGAGARVWLFGSRCKDDVRGGDLDLLIENDALLSTMQRARIKLALESSLEMPVDIVGIQRGMPPNAFQRIALETGVPLAGP